MEKDREEAEELKAKLANFKNSLVSGKVFGVRQDRGGKKKMHVLCTKDLKAFLFKSPMERGSIGHTIKFDDIRRIVHGCHVKAKAKPIVERGGRLCPLERSEGGDAVEMNLSGLQEAGENVTCEAG